MDEQYFLAERLTQLEKRVETNSHLLHLSEEMNRLKQQEKRNVEQIEETRLMEMSRRIEALENKFKLIEDQQEAIKKLENDHYRLLELTQELTETLKSLPYLQDEVEKLQNEQDKIKEVLNLNNEQDEEENEFLQSVLKHSNIQ